MGGGWRGSQPPLFFGFSAEQGQRHTGVVKMRTQGLSEQPFTLIELMIVVAIIAIIAAIAIPNLLESKMQANETNAVAALKQYGTAQYTYQKANYSNIPANGGVPKQYCQSFVNLGGSAAHTNAIGTPLTLIPAQFADSTFANGFQGYYFTEDTAVISWAYHFGLFADPCL